EKKTLEKSSKQLEKDIKSLDSGRDERIKYFERQVVELKKAAKQNVEKIEKQREKTEQAQVEVEVLRNELQALDAKDQDSGKGQEAILAEIEQMSENLEAKKESYTSAGERLEIM
ncbi:smc2, partial [Symbiodinium sp. KB8]